jgi:alkylation response protein AidB-like acyl-CoA dehydrogenase
MNLGLCEDELALRGAIRRFCDEKFAFERLRRLEGKAAHWRELAELGIFGLRLPEAEGGAGLGAASAALAFFELSRRLVPGPLLYTHLLAGRIAGAASGEVMVGGLDRATLGPEPVLIEHWESLGALVVLDSDGIHRVEPRDVAFEPQAAPLDPLTPLACVRSLPRGERLGGPEEAQAVRREGRALVAAQLGGIAEATCELATEYAKTREQFGRAIGSFQALKHLLADMHVRKEHARAAVYAAAATLDDPTVGDAHRAVAAARIVAGDAALANTRACLQVYGGMGYTWEAPPHYYLKRAWLLDTTFGSKDEHTATFA